MRFKFMGILLFLMIFTACSKAPSKEDAKKSIKQILPVEFDVAEVRKLDEIPGLVEVVLKLDRQHVIFYMDSKAKYIVSGSIVETATKKNITLERQNAFNPPQPVQAEQPKQEKTEPAKPAKKKQ